MDSNPLMSAAQQQSESSQFGAHEAFSIGASAINRIGVLVCGALQIASASKAEGHTAAFLADYLREVRNLVEDLGGMLEHERDTAAKREAKQ